MTAAQASRRLDERYELLEGSVYLSGLQALVRLPLDVQRADASAGLPSHMFISGYEGSPLGGYDLELLRHQRLLERHSVTLRQGLNEELAANAAQGTQLALARPSVKVEAVTAFWYGKAPGLDRATDAIRHSNLMGTHPRGGVVALVGDDATAKSSTVPSSSEMALAELCVPTLVPSDADDVLRLGLHAVAMSRHSGLWSALKIATNVADGTCTAHVAPLTFSPVEPEVSFEGAVYRHTPTAQMVQPVLGQLEHSLHHRRLVIAGRYARANGLNRVLARSPEARLGVVSYGPTFLDVCQALRRLGLDPETNGPVRVLRLGMVFPVDVAALREFAQGLDEILVVEEKRSFVESAIKEALYDMAARPAVSGKTTPEGWPLLRPEADLGPDLVAVALADRLAARAVPHDASTLDRLAPAPRELLPLAVRTPFFCSGCPHNRSTQVPSGSVVGAGIGCHGMAALLPPEKAGDVIGLTQMGGEGAPWIGMSGYVTDEHLFQNLGDGTFHHSGSLAVRAAVSADVNVTFKVLYNSAVAMTGGQQAVGQLSVPALCRLLLAEGVRRVVITTDEPTRYRKASLPPVVQVRHRDDLIAVQEELRAVRGTTVLIHDQECATELRRKRKRKLVEAPAVRAFINERVCEGCGDCGAKSNCLSVQPVETAFGRKTRIHQPSCNQDLSCLDGDCPSFLTVTPSGGSPRVEDGPGLPEISGDDLPDVVLPAAEQFGVRVVGVGGTGVVTVAQVVAMAACLDGLSVRALDQTGLAQKGGAVVSDIRISQLPLLETPKLATGECDLYIGCDSIVASSPLNLAACSRRRTFPVVSTAEVPTGAMVIDPTVSFPATTTITDQIASRGRPDAGVYLDAHAATRALFGDDQYANMLLVGAAYQAGQLPVSAASLEAAMALNGVAVEQNVQAFRRGRQYVADRASFLAALPAPGPSDRKEGSLEELVDDRCRELVAYQDQRYADRYAALVALVREAEERVVPGVTALAEAVCRNLYKVMAYKDEYEVARLSLDPALEESVKATFGPDATFAYRLHPPVLRALGMKRKLSLGPWFRHVFAVLYAMRRLRGSTLDVFGYAKIRRLERELVAEYETQVREVLRYLTPANHAVAVDLASAPDLIRGYEGVKVASVERYRARVATLRPRLHPAGSARA